MVPAFKMSNRRAEMELQAGSIAQSSLEKLRVASFDKVESTAFDDVTVDGTVYKVQVESKEPIEGGVPPQIVAKTVRVTVRWGWSENRYETFRETVFSRVPRA